MLAGGRFDVDHALHPLLLPAPAAARVVTIHDLHFLTHPERTSAEIRRDYPPLVRAHAHRADGIVVDSHFTAREVERRLERARRRITICPPGGSRLAAPRHAARPTTPTCSSWARSSRGRTSGALLDAYAHAARRDCPKPAAARARRPAAPDAEPWLRRLRAPAARRPGAARRLRRPEARRAVRRARACWCSRPSRRASACRSSKR